MSQRESGYARKERDLYETPAWVTEALLPHLRPCRLIWEPACGSGKMVVVLESFADSVIGTDIETGQAVRTDEAWRHLMDACKPSNIIYLKDYLGDDGELD